MVSTPSLPFRNAAITWFTEERPTELWSESLKYVAYGVETCPSTKRVHLQMWASMHKPQRLSGWKKVFPRAHIEVMRGTFEDNDNYCQKESDLTKIGERPNLNGQKSSLAVYKERIDAGESVLEIAREQDHFQTFLQYRNGLHEYKRHCRMLDKQNDREQPDVYVRIGPAGTGKTRWLDERFGTSGWISAPDNTGRWFDGCDVDVVLFDDVDAKAIPPLSQWKRLCDRYPIQVPVKGGFITWKPKTIVFTSNSHPFEWWPDLSQFDRDAIDRRITEIVVVDSSI